MCKPCALVYVNRGLPTSASACYVHSLWDCGTGVHGCLVFLVRFFTPDFSQHGYMRMDGWMNGIFVSFLAHSRITFS